MYKYKEPENSWVLDQLAVYQTANSAHQSVKNNFIVRKDEFQVIIDSLLDKKQNDPLQHELILGRRGSGKSTLLKRLQIEIVENPKLNQSYLAINLPEEQAGVYRQFDLWEMVMLQLKQQHHFEIQAPDYQTFENDQAYTRELYAQIHRSCEKYKKRIVLLLDNFDRIMENLADDGSLLREILINYSDVQIIAGSTRMDEHFWRYDMPFYDFFRTQRLESLASAEIQILVTHWGNSLGTSALKEFVQKYPGKIENVSILTDGMPRTYQFFIQMVIQKPESSSYEFLKKIMDNVSPAYQERMANLTAPLRKILLEMAFIWEACTTKQLVEATKMESKLISANLSTLVAKGMVDKIETSKKQHLYRISERFLNTWLILTQGLSEQKRVLEYLSTFLENWQIDFDPQKRQLSHPYNVALEKQYLTEINHGSTAAIEKLGVLYYEANANKSRALSYLKLVKSIRTAPYYLAKGLIIEIWNGIFRQVEQQALSIVAAGQDNVMSEFIEDLLVHEQKHLVLKLFQHVTHGPDLRDRNIIWYYVTMLLCEVQDDNLALKIPPELNPLIAQAFAKVESLQRFYGYR